MKKRVLIIDDTYDIVRFLKTECKEYDIEVISFNPTGPGTIADQLATTLSDGFDLVLLDSILWGEIPGEELVPIIKIAKVPFIGFSDEPDQNETFKNLGAVDIFLKQKRQNTGHRYYNPLFEMIKMACTPTMA